MPAQNAGDANLKLELWWALLPMGLLFVSYSTYDCRLPTLELKVQEILLSDKQK